MLCFLVRGVEFSTLRFGQRIIPASDEKKKNSFLKNCIELSVWSLLNSVNKNSFFKTDMQGIIIFFFDNYAPSVVYNSVLTP